MPAGEADLSMNASPCHACFSWNECEDWQLVCAVGYSISAPPREGPELGAPLYTSSSLKHCADHHRPASASAIGGRQLSLPTSFRRCRSNMHSGFSACGNCRTSNCSQKNSPSCCEVLVGKEDLCCGVQTVFSESCSIVMPIDEQIPDDADTTDVWPKIVLDEAAASMSKNSPLRLSTKKMKSSTGKKRFMHQPGRRDRGSPILMSINRR